MTLTEEQVLASAPDDASRKAGKELGSLHKWVSTGKSEEALWGACKGSGAKPYQTQVDLQQLAFKCSCPSRKFPCKHGIGLLLLFARQPQQIPADAHPDWVSEWLERRTATAEKKAEKQQEQAEKGSPANTRQRNNARDEKVMQGIEELLLWLKDMVRNGIIHLPEKNHSYWENTSRRLIDAQAPGLAAMVRNLGETQFFQQNWQQDFMQQLLRLYVVIQGYKHLEQLPEPLQEDIRQLCGFTVNQDYLRSLPGITDIWQVLGKQVTEQDRLVTERYWLYGENTRRTAVVLQFYTRHVTTAQFSLTPGTCINGELVYFPSASPLRAILKDYRNSNTTMVSNGMQQWDEVLAAQTEVSSLLPVFYDNIYILQQLQPVMHNGNWYLQDRQRQLMRIKDGYTKIWKLLAISGGKPLPMAVTGSQQTYEPIGIWDQYHQYKLL
ncbi:SWIM zinc finger domain-containing protein [Chitinophaga sp. Cy-1792]|uniref:SWIM zinc finger family protein n=1 Tax=Chitinophaga sp. Cy-1792 TaxID=2608339 RepID=UPI001422CE96|nr:SWIM zinc finger family protein [Chitinophaga sp. Cy-1792]NIG54945.1 SWIM zinc finger family protein [Chitinophaga sp. Cy-1792]